MSVGSFAAPSHQEFQAIALELQKAKGIVLRPGKESLVKSRLSQVLRERELEDFSQYIDALRQDTSGEMLGELIERMTTNKTGVFREPDQLAYLADTILPELTAGDASLKVWSAGCSSGEEPYTLAIMVREFCRLHRPIQARILATDISVEVLEIARDAIYVNKEFDHLDQDLQRRYLDKAGDAGEVQVKQELRSMISFARLNLMGRWPMSGPFDLILCRNVMIYFSAEVQRWLVERYRRMLRPGGYLLIGHSETIRSADGLAFVRPTIYRRIA